MPQPQPTPPADLTTRSLSLRLSSDGAPASLDAEARSVEVVCSTESLVSVIDWERYEVVDEVLLMSGCEIPASRQIPLLNSHYRGDISSVLGSCRDLRIEGGELIGRAHYSAADPVAEQAWQKTREGHLTDYSIGYRVIESTWIPEGKSQTIAGRSFRGPVKVATKWKVRELSTCPIGADELAKARAAAQPINPIREEKPMPEQADQNVSGRGDQNQAPAHQTPAPEPVRTLTEADVQRQAQEIARAEIVRREEIRTLCAHYGFEDLGRELIDGNKSLDEARQAVLKKHMTESPTAGGVGFRAAVIADERDKFRAAAQDAIVLRAGLRHDPAKLAPGALDLRGYSLRELAREALRIAGQSTGGDVMQMVGRALTVSDFPVLLGNTANLALMAGWEGAEETWETWADGSGSVSDFKTHTLARAGEVDDLDEIGEDDEYKYGSLAEQSETFKLATYGKLNKISRQAIINDELGSITDAFSRRGEAAARKVGDLVYAVLTANSAMGDGTALFHSSHGNLGTGGALGATTAAEAIKLMGLQKDIGGKRRLNIPARYFIGPKALEGSAEIFFGSQMLDVTTGSQQVNPYAGSRFVRVFDSRLDDDSSAAYYFAGPKGKTVKVFFLNGNRTPYLETKQGWNVDGVELKTRIDAGAKALSWKALVKNAGK